MTEEQSFEDVDISDIIDDSEQYPDSDNLTEFHNTETTDPENQHNVQSSEIIGSEDQVGDKKPQRSEIIRSTKLPMARIKNIMKMDPDVSVVSSDAVFLVTKATELFLETIAKETYAYTSTNKRKVVSKKDLDLVINKVDCLCFLEGAMDF